LWDDALDRLTTALKDKGIVRQGDEQGERTYHELC
jgi:hypothetical protein